MTPVFCKSTEEFRKSIPGGIFHEFKIAKLEHREERYESGPYMTQSARKSFKRIRV